jgi:hypothetical protein
MPLVVKRKINQTWRDAVASGARKCGVEQGCLRAYDAHVDEGMHEAEAAYRALADFDALFVVADAPVPGRREEL